MPAKSTRPKLSVIETPPTGFEPSSNTAGAKLWRKIQAEHQFRRAGDVALLIEACIMLDRAEQLAECIAEDGPTFKIGGIPKSHPALRDEIQCRAFVTRTLARLGAVGTDAKKRPPGRPPVPQSGSPMSNCKDYRRMGTRLCLEAEFGARRARTLPVESRDSFLVWVSQQMRPRPCDLDSAIQRAVNFLRQQHDRAA